MPSTPTSRKSPVVPLTVAAVAVIAVIAALLAGRGSDDADAGRPADETSASGAPSQQGSAADQPLARREPGDPMAIGDVDAPVVMVSYAEFQCPFCGKFARDTEPDLVRKYVDKGVLRIEWRDFPYLGPESTTAARAGRAAAAQDSFWEFHDALFANQLPPNSGRLTEDHLVSVAGDLGLDTEKFRADMNSEAAAQAVQRDFQEGQKIGVTGTPAFIINGVPVMGAQPTQIFEQAIEVAADEAGMKGS